MSVTRQVSREEAWKRLVNRFSCHIPPIDRGSTLEWGRYFLPNYFQYNPSILHVWLEEILDRRFCYRGKKAAVIAPRGGAKSTIVTLTHVLKQAVTGVEPFILIFSDTEDQAVANLTNIKAELEENIILQDDYPHACGRGPVWNNAEIKLRNGVRIKAIGTGGKIRGRRDRHERPSLIVCDDVENDSHIVSVKERERTETWFSRTVMNMGDARTNIIVLGSALHSDSLLMKLQRKTGWMVRRGPNGKASPFRSIEKWPTNLELWDRWEDIYNSPDDPEAEKKADKFFKSHRREMEAGSKLCWPDREPLYPMMKLRADIGAAAFEGERQGNPINPSTCEWPEKYFTHDKFWFDEWPDDLVIKGMSLDPSKGKTDKRHDYSAIVTAGVTRDGIVYVDCDLDKRSSDQIAQDAVDIYGRFKPFSLAIETNQFQELLADLITDTAERYGTSIHLTPYENFTSKRIRIRRLSGLLSQKRIRFKTNSEGSTLCVQQMKDFPNGDHDDGPDAVEMVCRLMFGQLEEEDDASIAIGLQKLMEQFQ